MIQISSHPQVTLTEADRRTIKENHGNAVATALEQKVDEINKTLRWKSTIEGSLKRFETTFQAGSRYFAQIRFSESSRNYRAILCWVERAAQFAILRVVQKEESYNTSKQRKLITMIQNNGEKIVADAADKLASQNSE